MYTFYYRTLCILCHYLSEVSVSTRNFRVRMNNGNFYVWQYLPTLDEAEAVGSSSLEHCQAVHPQRPLVHINCGRLRVLRTTQTQDGVDPTAKRG